MEKLIRSFIAIELPEKTHEYLTTLITGLKKMDLDAKWVKPANIHLTLKFLGYITENQIPQIKNALDKTAGQQHVFDITLGSLGAFPKTDYAKILWFGIKEHKEKLLSLVEDMEIKLIDLGFEPEDRGFHPHLTLARIKSGRNREALKQAVEDFNSNPGQAGTTTGLSVPVNRLTFFQSTLSSQGPVYTILHQAELQK